MKKLGEVREMIAKIMLAIDFLGADMCFMVGCAEALKKFYGALLQENNIQDPKKVRDLSNDTILGPESEEFAKNIESLFKKALN